MKHTLRRLSFLTLLLFIMASCANDKTSENNEENMPENASKNKQAGDTSGHIKLTGNLTLPFCLTKNRTISLTLTPVSQIIISKLQVLRKMMTT